MLGYKIIKHPEHGKILAFDDEHVLECIREGYENYSTGKLKYIRSVQRLFKDKGVKSRIGKDLSFCAIRNILSSTAYAGYVIVDDKEYKTKHKAIVSRELFDSVQVILEKNSETKKETIKTMKVKTLQDNYLLNETLRCIGCSKRVFGKYAKKIYPYYNCTAKKCNDMQKRRGIKANILDEAFSQYIIKQRDSIDYTQLKHLSENAISIVDEFIEEEIGNKKPSEDKVEQLEQGKYRHLKNQGRTVSTKKLKTFLSLLSEVDGKNLALKKELLKWLFPSGLTYSLDRRGRTKFSPP